MKHSSDQEKIFAILNQINFDCLTFELVDQLESPERAFAGELDQIMETSLYEIAFSIWHNWYGSMSRSGFFKH